MVTEGTGATEGRGLLQAACVRAAAYLVLWLALAGYDPADLPAAAVAVAGATWASLRLLPPGQRRLSLPGAAPIALRFPWQSLVAGIDVAWRALAPGLNLRPGIVAIPQRLPPGTPQDAFAALASLLPGTLPVETDEAGMLLVHCLDTGQPVEAQMAAEEALFARAMRERPGHG